MNKTARPEGQEPSPNSVRSLKKRHMKEWKKAITTVVANYKDSIGLDSVKAKDIMVEAFGTATNEDQEVMLTAVRHFSLVASVLG